MTTMAQKLSSPVKFVTTKSDKHAIWENGGCTDDFGEAVVVAGPHGEKLKPIFVKRKGHLSNGFHALFPVRDQMFVLHGKRAKDNIILFSVLRVSAPDENIAPTTETVWKGRLKGWEEDESSTSLESLDSAVDALVEKLSCHHCRKPHYAIME